MREAARVLRFAFLLVVFVALSARAGQATSIVYEEFFASFDTGSLAGVTFDGTYSFDASQIQATGYSYIVLNTLDFTLLGTPFTKSYIEQGGQVILDNGVLDNFTASFQGTLPPGAPVENVTFGFGGPGIIGYIDLKGMFGSGSFTSTPIPEPSSFILFLAGIVGLVRSRA